MAVFLSDPIRPLASVALVLGPALARIVDEAQSIARMAATLAERDRKF